MRRPLPTDIPLNQLKANRRSDISNLIDQFKSNRDVSLIDDLTELGNEFGVALGKYHRDNPEIPRWELFSFDIEKPRYILIEHKVRGSEPDPILGPDTIVEDPEWLMSGYLGTYSFDDEVFIPFQFNDVSNIVTGMRIVGSLPNGIEINEVGFSLFGYIENENTRQFSFDVILETVDNREFTESFNLNVINTETVVEWETDSDLGSYGIGSSVNQSIDANAKDVPV